MVQIQVLLDVELLTARIDLTQVLRLAEQKPRDEALIRKEAAQQVVPTARWMSGVSCCVAEALIQAIAVTESQIDIQFGELVKPNSAAPLLEVNIHASATEWGKADWVEVKNLIQVSLKRLDAEHQLTAMGDVSFKLVLE
jgi:hypothetical protein